MTLLNLTVAVNVQGATHCEEREGWAIFSDGLAYPHVSILCGETRARALAFAWAHPELILQFAIEEGMKA